MKLRGIKIGDLISKYPIMQGGMGVGVSMHKLAGNVAKEGGIGIISTADIGYQEPEFEKDPMKANIKAIKTEIKNAAKVMIMQSFPRLGLLFISGISGRSRI